MEFKIQNLVATVDLRFPIRLEHLNQMHGQFSSYEPELFPGLIYRMVKPRVVLLVFVNGKIVFTGAKNKSEIRESLENIFPILQSFRKNWCYYFYTCRYISAICKWWRYGESFIQFKTVAKTLFGYLFWKSRQLTTVQYVTIPYTTINTLF